MKKQLNLILIIFISLIIFGTIFFFIRGTALTGIGTDYTLNTEEHRIIFHTNDERFVKIGCIEEHPATWCKSEYLRSEDGCDVYTLWDCKVTCEDEISKWGYGCEPKETSDGWKCYYYRNDEYYEHLGECADAITSPNKPVLDWGGIKYDTRIGCSWWVELQDQSGSTIEKFYSGIDDKPYYIENIDYQKSNLKLNYVNNVWGAVQQRTGGDNIYGCIAVEFQAKDDRYIYNVCLGNDGYYYEEEPYCEDTVTKTCILQCNDPDKELDIDSCECIDKQELPPVPDPIDDDDDDEQIPPYDDDDDDEQIPPIDDDDDEQIPPYDDDKNEGKLTQYILYSAIALILISIIILIIKNKNKRRIR